MDNLLTFKLAQELVTKKKMEAVLLKADFYKAYDCVEHTFIWDTMKSLGFAPHIIQLAQGLVEQAESKVHINGLFTPAIALERGVRQGCPLFTLLFTISTQPFMELIKEKTNSGELAGIDLGRG